MANIKPIGGTFEDMGEAVAPVKDAVGEAIEQGVKSIIQPAPKLTPQQQVQRQQQKVTEQKEMAGARYKIDWWKNLAAEQNKVRGQTQQETNIQKQQEQEEEQKKQEAKIKQFVIQKKQQEVNPALARKGKAEIKGGVGG